MPLKVETRVRIPLGLLSQELLAGTSWDSEPTLGASCSGPAEAAILVAVAASKLRRSTGAFRLVAYVEAISYLLLLVAVVVHRVLDGPDWVGVLGPIHGIAFLVYLGLVLHLRDDQGWGLRATVVVIVAGAVPLGGFWAGHHLREERASTLIDP